MFYGFFISEICILHNTRPPRQNQETHEARDERTQKNVLEITARMGKMFFCRLFIRLTHNVLRVHLYVNTFSTPCVVLCVVDKSIKKVAYEFTTKNVFSSLTSMVASSEKINLMAFSYFFLQ